MEYTYIAHIQLNGTRPRRLGLYVLSGWGISLFLLLFFPTFSDRLLFTPSVTWLSFPGPLYTPFSWGASHSINVMGLVLSAMVMWLFGGRLHNRLQTPRLIGLSVMALGSALAVYVALSFFINTGVVMLGPALAVSVLLATAKVNNDLPILYKNYLVGNTKYLPYVTYIYTGFGLLVNMGKGPGGTLFLSMAAAQLAVLLFFDRRLFARLTNRVIPRKNRPKLWGMRGGKWGN